MAYAQIGINTDTPSATLDIVSSDTKTILVKNSSNTEIFTLLNTGSVGIGQPNPAVRLDARAVSGDAAIGIGNTNQTAADAKAGAVRYNGGLEYSNGVVWTKVKANPVKALVVALCNDGTLTFPSPSSTRITNWTKIHDTTNSFDASTGTFTAPRAGVYTVSFSYNFLGGTIAAGSQAESIWRVVGGNDYKCVNAFPAAGASQAGSTCSVSIKLNAGQQIYPFIFHTLGTTKTLRTGAVGTSGHGFNNLSIVEL